MTTIPNQVELKGVLTRDPELRYTPSGYAVTSINIKTKTRGNGFAFINVVLWRDLAEFVANEFRSGDTIHFIGKFTSRSFDSREGGKVYVQEIVADALLDRDASSEEFINVVQAEITLMSDARYYEPQDKKVANLLFSVPTSEKAKAFGKGSAWGDEAVKLKDKKKGDVVSFQGYVKLNTIEKEGEKTKRELELVMEKVNAS